MGGSGGSERGLSSLASVFELRHISVVERRERVLPCESAEVQGVVMPCPTTQPTVLGQSSEIPARRRSTKIAFSLGAWLGRVATSRGAE